MVWPWILSVAFNFQVAAWSQPQADIRFEKKQLKVGKIILTVEVADTAEKQARGLMYRTSLEDGHGMFFIFDAERQLSFWMKNTFIPLDIGYFDRSKKLVDIQQMDPVGSLMELPKSYPSKRPAQYALEVPRGWFKKNRIKEGAIFHLD